MSGSIGPRDWLLSDTPWSRHQARLGEIYRLLRELVGDPLVLLGAVLASLLILSALLAPFFIQQDFGTTDAGPRLHAPSSAWWFGTDDHGRDIFSLVLVGTRTPLAIALVAIGLAAPLGLLSGCFAGYLGGGIDATLTRIVDYLVALPRLLLGLALVAAMGGGTGSVIIALFLALWPRYARRARDAAAALREADFVCMARLQGASPSRIIVVQIAPLCCSSALARIVSDVAEIVLVVAGFGFLGLAAEQPTVEWGAMIAAGRTSFPHAWWVVFFPGLAALITSLAFNFVGNGIRATLARRGW